MSHIDKGLFNHGNWSGKLLPCNMSTDDCDTDTTHDKWFQHFRHKQTLNSTRVTLQVGHTGNVKGLLGQLLHQGYSNNKLFRPFWASSARRSKIAQSELVNQQPEQLAAVDSNQ